MKTTNDYSQEISNEIRNLFKDKNSDYGTSWRIMRMEALTDQIYIKAKRIKTLQDTGLNKVGESIESEYRGIFNYAILALVQKKLITNQDPRMDISPDELMKFYDEETEAIFNLLQKKNHDYGEAWRDMREKSYCDFILVKLLRIKQIEENQGAVKVSENTEGGYRDIVNYALFALIRIKENKETT